MAINIRTYYWSVIDALLSKPYSCPGMLSEEPVGAVFAVVIECAPLAHGSAKQRKDIQ